MFQVRSHCYRLIVRANLGSEFEETFTEIAVCLLRAKLDVGLRVIPQRLIAIGSKTGFTP